MNIVSKKKRRVCLMMRYYLYRLHLGIVDYAHEAGWVLDASMSLDGEIPQYWHGDGIISFHCDDDLIINKIIQENVPTVDLGKQSSKLKLPNVIHDNIAIGRMAGEYLVGLGLQHIGYINSTCNVNDQERESGLREVAFAEQRQFYSLNLAELASLEFLPKPIGIMAQNDAIALRVLDYCLSRGWKVPDEIAVMGADDDDLQCRLAEVPLTSVDDNVYNCGYEAAKLLDALMDGQAVPTKPVLIPPSRVIARQSTDIIAINHTPTVKALNFIRENYSDPTLSVEQIADNAGMCRRRLDDFFKELVGNTLAQELKRFRIDKACQLLSETDYKMYVITYQCGFTSAERLAKVFSREIGVTPSHYRNMNRK